MTGLGPGLSTPESRQLRFASVRACCVGGHGIGGLSFSSLGMLGWSVGYPSVVGLENKPGTKMVPERASEDLAWGATFTPARAGAQVKSPCLDYHQPRIFSRLPCGLRKQKGAKDQTREKRRKRRDRQDNRVSEKKETEGK